MFYLTIVNTYFVIVTFGWHDSTFLRYKDVSNQSWMLLNVWTDPVNYYNKPHQISSKFSPHIINHFYKGDPEFAEKNVI